MHTIENYSSSFQIKTNSKSWSETEVDCVAYILQCRIFFTKKDMSHVYCKYLMLYLCHVSSCFNSFYLVLSLNQFEVIKCYIVFWWYFSCWREFVNEYRQVGYVYIELPVTFLWEQLKMLRICMFVICTISYYELIVIYITRFYSFWFFCFQMIKVFIRPFGDLKSKII